MLLPCRPALTGHRDPADAPWHPADTSTGGTVGHSVGLVHGDGPPRCL